MHGLGRGIGVSICVRCRMDGAQRQQRGKFNTAVGNRRGKCIGIGAGRHRHLWRTEALLMPFFPKSGPVDQQ